MEGKMKTFVIIFFALLLCGNLVAGELRDLPQYLVLSDPSTNKSEFLTL
jgi:hypothetical protein